eukprot:2626434-Alexandrium_andersonii.AAC.1
MRRPRTAQSATGIVNPSRACGCAKSAVVAMRRRQPAGCGALAARRACCAATPRLEWRYTSKRAPRLV